MILELCSWFLVWIGGGALLAFPVVVAGEQRFRFTPADDDEAKVLARDAKRGGGSADSGDPLGAIHI